MDTGREHMKKTYSYRNKISKEVRKNHKKDEIKKKSYKSPDKTSNRSTRRDFKTSN